MLEIYHKNECISLKIILIYNQSKLNNVNTNSFKHYILDLFNFFLYICNKTLKILNN